METLRSILLVWYLCFFFSFWNQMARVRRYQQSNENRICFLHILVPSPGGTKDALHVLVTPLARVGEPRMSFIFWPPHAGEPRMPFIPAMEFQWWIFRGGRGRRGRGGQERGLAGVRGRSPRETVYNVYDRKGCDAKQWMRQNKKSRKLQGPKI